MTCLKAVLLSLLITLIFISGPLAVIINCFIFQELLWLFIFLLVVLFIIGVLIFRFYYLKLRNKK